MRLTLLLVLVPAIAHAELGVTDKGIFGDLDEKVSLALPADLKKDQVEAVIDGKRLVVYEGKRPVKVYPLGGGTRLKVGAEELSLRAADAKELAPVLEGRPISKKLRGGDSDGDGIPNALDLLIGGKKVALNGAAYSGGYVKLSYPNGDVPRDVGVCTDVVVRAVRNAGIDLQKELHEDIKRARKSYPMVKKPDKNIDHRRVKTLLPYFKRHWEARGTDLASADDPYLPGDIVFMDTFPSRSGPDHIGIVSDLRGESGHYLVINNWTDGTNESEMDLLGWVPVTHRFRIRER